jgi:hypothetical protein
MSKNPQPKSIPGKGLIRRTSRAGIGGGVILIGLALYLLFRGFGLGGPGAAGSGIGSESESGGTAMITKGDSSTTNGSTTALAAPDTVEGGLSDDEKKALSGTTLTVLIDEHDYLLELPGTPDPMFRPTPLERIVELATLAKGDTNGTRVRILRRQSSRASAEEKLKLELDRRGVHADAIVMPSEFVP